MTEDAPKSLKLLVWGMGVVLLGGFLFLFATLAGKASDATSRNEAACEPAKLPFAPAQLAQAPAYENGVWAVVIRAPGTISLMEIDACTGQVLSTLSNTVEAEYP